MDKGIVKYLKNTNLFKEIINNINKKDYPLNISGLEDSIKPFLTKILYKESKKQILYVCASDYEAKKRYEELKPHIEDDIIYFLPSEDIFFYFLEARDRKEDANILDILYRLYKKENIILIVSIESLLRKYMPMDIFKDSIIDIKIGQQLDLVGLTKELIAFGYEREEIVEGIGQFSIRGGIIDFYPPCSQPVRIELFDDEVDSIRYFDAQNQKSIEKIKSCSIMPTRQVIYPNEYDKDKILEEAKEIKNEDFYLILDKLKNNSYIENLENYIDYLYKDMDKSLFSYFEEDFLIILNDFEKVKERLNLALDEFHQNFLDSREKGWALKSQGDLLYKEADFYEFLENKNVILYENLFKNKKLINEANLVNLEIKESSNYNSKLSFLKDELLYYKKRNYKIVLSFAKDELAKNMQEFLKDESITYSSVKDIYKSKNNINVITADISEGFEYKEGKFLLITDKEIFGNHKKKKKRIKRKNAKKIDSFLELEVNDYVVHENHGLGKYLGIDELKLDGIKKDYMKLKYNGDDVLYVPIDQIDKVQKYIGAKHSRVKLNKMGSNEWQKTKAKTKKSIEDMAKDLIELYSKREKVKGYAFSKDTSWQREFENLFPFEETNDQIKAIEEVKSDMEKEEVMDRLICGDVGYGKTEVAIRAIFKACMDSKQVAVLVPTTILAQQHYENFKDRFEKFPIRVEVLSRFKTLKEQRQIIEDLNLGLVDVIIGTHKILSKDIKYKNLGLLVVDEEQRFGVKHKESLKKFKTSVDVLTLSATPIPRTLHMSLSGIRDLSTIEEPPEERHPVLTYVVESKDDIIADAIERELYRKGQVFFVYNRVENIEKMAVKIKSLVKDARVALAHGQMTSRNLEKIMVDFLNKEYDVLVCTTIIETGMDISNANTIIIYDADKMGLSQLYQLRGRVGRSKRQGYSYLMYEKDKVLNEVSQKRLKAIKEFTEFGSGFKIAMRDLEIRGAGNVLGSNQHGHMSTIGYDLYVKMLSESIKKLKGEEIIEDVDTEIDLKLNAYIPKNYIKDEKMKIDIYKRIALIKDKNDMYELEEEIEDRFSTLPLPVINLLRVGYIKSMAKKLNIKSIKHLDNKILFEPYYRFVPKFDKGYELVENIVNEMEKFTLSIIEK